VASRWRSTLRGLRGSGIIADRSSLVRLRRPGDQVDVADRDIVSVIAAQLGHYCTTTAAVTRPKSNPADIAKIAVDGIQADLYEILADGVSRHVQAGLAGGVAALYPDLP
jgi:hypothetical protein